MGSRSGTMWIASPLRTSLRSKTPNPTAADLPTLGGRATAMIRTLRIHDLVVFEKQKHGAHPSVRAHDVRPAPLGEDYDYVIDKYWIVVRVTDDGRLLLRTPGGKLHEIRANDPNLRRP